MAPFPSPQSTLPFWRTQPHDLDTHRSTKDLPLDCEVLIIGAGYAGASTAYHLLSDGTIPTPSSVVILEARQACSGATGRNGGHLRPVFYPNYIAQYGLEAAVEIANFEMAHLQAIKNLVETEHIDCDLAMTRSFDCFLNAAHAKSSKDAYDKMIAEGLTVKDAHWIPPDDSEVVTGVHSAHGGFSFPAAHLHPYKLIMALLSLSLKKGLNLQTTTPVTHISPLPSPTDGTWIVTTPRGIIRAQKIVIATNGYTAGILPEYEGNIIPCKGICSRIVVPAGNRAGPKVKDTYSIDEEEEVYDYLIPRADGSIIVGGARVNTGGKKTAREREETYGVWDDSTLIEPVKDYFNGYMQRTFIGWENSGAVTDRVWTGIMSYTSDHLPHIGPIPSLSLSQPNTPASKPNQFILAGFNGHGMPVIFLAAKAIAEMLGGKKYEETGLPGLYRTSSERLRSD